MTAAAAAAAVCLDSPWTLEPFPSPVDADLEVRAGLLEVDRRGMPL